MLKHKWFSKKQKEIPIDKEAFQKIDFDKIIYDDQFLFQLKKLYATKLKTIKEIQHLTLVFQKFDVNKSGTLDLKEF